MPVINGGIRRNITIPAPSIGLAELIPFSGELTPVTGATPTFTRTSNAWQLNGALVAHNVLLQSNAFDTTWTMTNGSITKNATDPFGVANNAWTLIPSNVSNANHWLAQSITFASAGVFSFYVKAAGYTFVRAANSPNNYVEFDLSAVTATYGTGWSGASITAVGNGWYRCSMIQSTSTNWASVVITATPASYNVNATYTFAGDGVSGVILYGAQLNAYSLTTYVPTTSAAVYLPRYEQGKSGQGILIEGSTTNKLSSADSQSIATSATCTTTAAAHTVSVRTGSLTLSGTMTGTVTPGNPVTATASAGTLTLTGTATLVQVEAKSYATSWVIGGATRNAETLTFNPTGILNASAGTISCWVYTDKALNTRVIFDSIGTNEVLIYCDAAGAIIAGANGVTGRITTASGKLQLNKWTHIALTWVGGGTQVCYVNGTSAGSGSPGTTTDYGTTSYIGTQGSNFPFEGTIDQLRIYNRALTASEVLQLYRAGR